MTNALSEPREWWIYQDGKAEDKSSFEPSAYFKDGVGTGNIKHAIEYSAFAKLQAENDELRETSKLNLMTANEYAKNAAELRCELDQRDRSAMSEGHRRVEYWREVDGERARLIQERDCYAEAMAVALRDGIFPHKEKTKSEIERILGRAALEAANEKGEM